MVVHSNEMIEVPQGFDSLYITKVDSCTLELQVGDTAIYVNINSIDDMIKALETIV